jgi:hypothetical protein
LFDRNGLLYGVKLVNRIPTYWILNGNNKPAIDTPLHIVTKMIDSINMASTIAGLMNAGG